MMKLFIIYESGAASGLVSPLAAAGRTTGKTYVARFFASPRAGGGCVATFSNFSSDTDLLSI